MENDTKRKNTAYRGSKRARTSCRLADGTTTFSSIVCLSSRGARSVHENFNFVRADGNSSFLRFLRSRRLFAPRRMLMCKYLTTC